MVVLSVQALLLLVAAAGLVVLMDQAGTAGPQMLEYLVAVAAGLGDAARHPVKRVKPLPVGKGALVLLAMLEELALLLV